MGQTVEEATDALTGDHGHAIDEQIAQMNARLKGAGKPPVKPEDYTVTGEGDDKKLVWSEKLQEEIANLDSDVARDRSMLVKKKSTLVRRDGNGPSKIATSKEVQYWQVAAKIENGECDHVYAKPSGAPTDPNAVWERSGIVTSINHDKPGDSKGLSNKEWEQLFGMWGKNELTPKNVVSPLMKLFLQFTGFFSLLLLVGGLLCFIAYAVDPKSPENVCLYLLYLPPPHQHDTNMNMTLHHITPPHHLPPTVVPRSCAGGCCDRDLRVLLHSGAICGQHDAEVQGIRRIYQPGAS